MKSLQDMITEIHAATDAEGTSYKSIQDMIYDIWLCVAVDETTGENYIRVKPEE